MSGSTSTTPPTRIFTASTRAAISPASPGRARGRRGGSWISGAPTASSPTSSAPPGWDVEGVEISEIAAQYARDRFGLTVYPDFEKAIAANGEGAFDVITFFQVLSQLPSSAAALDSAHALLRPGGIVMVESSNRGGTIARALGRHWHLIAPPSVISLFEPETLDGLLRRRGFEPVARFPTRKAVSVGLVANVLEQRYGRVFSPLRSLGAKPAVRGRAIRYPFADLMTVVAERR